MPNCRYSMSISTYKPNPEEWEFEHNVRIAQLAEAENFDFLFPSARWRGVGGKTNYQGTNIETLTWAASMLQRTERIGVYSTVHVPVYHPFLVAKVGAGLDYMSGGRWGLNVVSGWNQPEFEMMGLEMEGHEKRYERTTDFIKVIKGLWTAKPGTFDFDSEWYRIRRGWISPMPKSQPHPPIINAGTSDAGRNLVANHCDWSFMIPPSIDLAGEMIGDIKRRAARAGREVRCVAALFLILGKTQAEADGTKQKIVDGADTEALENWMAGVQMDSESFDAHTLDMLCLSGGSLPVVGTRETIAEAIIDLYRAGIDGVLLSFLDYLESTEDFAHKVIPLLRDAGIR